MTEKEKCARIYAVVCRRELYAWQVREVAKYFKGNHEQPYMLMAPRRNGKSEVLKAITIYLLFCGKRVLWTCHNQVLATEVYTDFVSSIGKTQLASRSMDSRALSTKTGGGYLRVAVRSGDLGVGTGWDLLIVDEVQEYRRDQAAALVPTVATSSLSDRSRAIIYAGTAPKADAKGDVINDRITAEKRDPSLSYYGVNKFVKKPTKRDWSKKTVNPSYGVLLFDDYFKSILADGTLADFNNEQLGFNTQLDPEPVVEFSAETINLIRAKNINKHEPPVVDARVVAIRHDALTNIISMVEAFTLVGDVEQLIYVDVLATQIFSAKSINALAEVSWHIAPESILIDSVSESERIKRALANAGLVKGVRIANKVHFVANYAKVTTAVNTKIIRLVGERAARSLGSVVGNSLSGTAIKRWRGTYVEAEAEVYAIGLSLIGMDSLL